jgi:phosphoribosyl 1,2-cyclic phosphodiesterase
MGRPEDRAVNFVAHASSSAGNFYVAEAEGGHRLAIECGLSIRRIRAALGFPLTDLDAVLVSHHHGDHSRAAEHFLRAGVPVCCSRECADALGIAQHHRWREARPGVELGIGAWRVSPWWARHDAPGALGFFILAPDGDRLLYACDTAYVPHRFAGLTHVAIECNWSRAAVWSSGVDVAQKRRVVENHMGLDRVLAMLAANDLSRVREIHLLHLSDRHGDEAEFRAAVERATGKPTRVAPRSTI